MCIICELKAQQRTATTPEQAIDQAVDYVAGVMQFLTDQPLSEADLAEVRVNAINAFKEAGIISPDYSEGVAQQEALTAKDFLVSAGAHMADRAKTYDAPQGERSMGKTVAAFNTITGKNLSEQDGWLFMALLKAVRANQGDFRLDNYEDLVAYTALLGESAAQANQQK